MTTENGDGEDGEDGDDREKIAQLLQERIPNDNRPPDGLIYERIRYYEGYLGGPIDEMAAKDWWAILERAPGKKKSRKASYLRSFLKNRNLPAKLDALIPISGIWEGMSIGSLHKLIWMRCDEVSANQATSNPRIEADGRLNKPIMCYWELIYETFLALVGGDRELLRQIDGATVLHLQSRAPGISTQDLAVLEKRMQSGDLFREIDHEQRYGIWERLKRVDYPIPTLHTFFKDRLYLEVGQSVMRQLCTFSPETYVTIDECVMEQYDTYVPLSRHQRVEMLTPDLRELWRFSLQYGFEMTPHRRLVRRAQTQGSTPRPQTSLPTFDQPTFWQAFFQVAIQRGFRIPDHHELLGTPTALPSVAACDYPAEASEEIPVGQRCGKPLVDSAAADRFALSAESLDGPWDASRVSAVLLRRSFFHAFFRYLKSDSEGPLPREHAPHDPLANPHQEGAVEEPLTDTSNTAVFTHVANTPEPIPFYSLPNPPLTLQPNFLISIPQLIFPMDFAIYNYTYSLDLPNNLEILPQFFQELS